MTATPPYDAAVAAFRCFLAEQEFSPDLVWVFREDVTNCWRHYWVRIPLPDSNAVLARQYFELGRQKGLGVTLEVLCRLEGRSACFVWWPEDSEAAFYAMQEQLKLKVPAEPVDAVPIRYRWLWVTRCWINRFQKCTTFEGSLPSRGALC